MNFLNLLAPPSIDQLTDEYRAPIFLGVSTEEYSTVIFLGTEKYNSIEECSLFSCSDTRY
jgi:hypothetical protein